MIDGRGKSQVVRKILLTEKIRDFIGNNKTLNRKQTGEAIGISQNTLRVHLKIIDGGD